MKNILWILGLVTTSVMANFNFGECSGSGSFEQQIVHFNGDYEKAMSVGVIPAGIEGLKINLISDKDVDIRLYGANKDKIVHWPYGLLSKSYAQKKSYQDVNVTYSGYNGTNEEKGHEFIEVDGATPSAMTMKAFGYQAGYATVNYSWTGKVDCTADDNGTGNFIQNIEENATTFVGTIPPDVENLEINLTSENDIDIQLYGEDGTAIVSWNPRGLLSGSMKDTISYHGMTIEWSGYNGVDGQKGDEYIKVSPLTNELLTMKVFGYKAGTANVTYRWGNSDNNDTNTTPADTTAPVITLLGSTPVTVIQGDTYTDAGASANDNVDGDITANIVVHNPVDIAVIGTYIITYDVNDTAGNVATQVSRTVNVVAPADTSAYTGTPVSLPGIVEAEYYNKGGEGVAYHDTDSENNAVAYNKDTLRPDEGVDIEATNDGSYNIGWIEDGEYTNYTVNVSEDGYYDIEAKLASKYSGILRVIFSGNGATREFAAENTGDWQNWTTVTKNGIYLTAGKQVLKMEFSGSFNIDRLTITKGVKVEDTTPPVITLSSSTITVIEGNKYVDSGVTANDDIDGDISDKIISESNLDTSIIGTYYIKYNVSDSAGNSAEEVIRTINVVGANEKPTNNQVSIVGSDIQYSKIQEAIDAATNGDTISIGEGVYNESLYINKNLNIIGTDGVILSGEQEVSSWQYDSNKELYYAPSPCGRIDFLFSNGIQQKPAFFPRDGYISGSTSDSKGFQLDNESYKRVGIFTKNTTNITIPNDLVGTLAIMHFRPWERSASYVSSISGNSVTMESTSAFYASAFTGLRFAYVVSAIENIGEWGMSNNTIYLKSDTEPTNVTTTCKDDGILIGSSAHQVTIDNVDITKYKGYGVRFYGSIDSIPHVTNRTLNAGDDIVIKNSRLNYLGFSGIALRSSNQEENAKIEIANNEIDHVLATGIALYNTYGSDIHHNYLHEIGGEKYGDELVSRNSWGVGTAIQLDTTPKAHIYNNHLKNLGYIGVNITHWGGVPVGGRVIENNFIENVIQSLNDGGGIYRYGGLDDDNKYGWDKILNNIVLNSNGYIGFSIEDMHYQGAGIYTDNKSIYVEIANNTIVKSGHGLYYHENKYINGHHNTLVDGQWASFTIYQGDTNIETKFNYNIVVNSNSNEGWNTVYYPGIGISESDNNIYRTYASTALSGKTLQDWQNSYGFDLYSKVFTNRSQKPIVLINPTNSNLSFNNLDGCKNLDDSTLGSTYIDVEPYSSLVLFECTNYIPGTYNISK